MVVIMKYDKMQADILKGFVKTEYWLDNAKGFKFFYKENEDSVEYTTDGHILFNIPKKAWFITVPAHISQLQKSFIEAEAERDLQYIVYSHSVKLDGIKNPVDIFKMEDGTEICVNPDLYKGYLDKWDNDLVFKGTSPKSPVFAFNRNHEVVFMVLPINRKGC